MNGKRIHLAAIGSTNSYTMDLLSHSDIPEWTVVTSDHQVEGRGQRGRNWNSEPKANLLCSVFIRPKISVRDQYLISMAVSLAIVDVLVSQGMVPSIKWPNDILVNGKKIAGILIENQVKGERVESSVLGIGLNVNQTDFPSFLWPATSMTTEAGKRFNLEDVLDELLGQLRLRMTQSFRDANALSRDHAHWLYGKSEEVAFSFDGKTLHGILRGVEASGALLMTVKEEDRKFFNGEIRLLRTST
ncbi:MAG: biotin--[acetyl-CoA-carboxylase] ligase [Cryomorphaceae bacterium]